MQIRPATPDDPSIDVAKLIWTTDPALMHYLFGTFETWQKVVCSEWPLLMGFSSHALANVAIEDGQIHGVTIGIPPGGFDANLQASRNQQARALDDEEAEHLRVALQWLERIFPAPWPDAYYVLDLAVDPAFHGTGLGRRLLDAAIENARAAGCRSLCLDVAADNRAVEFYHHCGMHIEIETTIPHLRQEHSIGTHYHMTLQI